MSIPRVGLFAFCLALGGSPAIAEDLTEIGVARVEITPSYPVRMTGYQGRTKPSEGVDHPLYAKALAIGSDAETPALIVTVDNLGVGDAMVEEVAARLQKETGLDRARLTISSSHTHSAPALTGVAPHIFGKKLSDEEQRAIDRYTSELTDKLELVCIEAIQNRKPGRLSWTQGSAGFAFNRRTKGGPVDLSLPVLKVTDPDGSLRAVLVNYACHCTTIAPLVNKIDGDWAGYAQSAIEADFPTAIAMTTIGCGADSNPLQATLGTVETAKAHGKVIADEVKRLMAGEWKSLGGAPKTAFKRFTLDFDALPAEQQLEALAAKGKAEGYNASVLLAKLRSGHPLQSKLNYSVQSWWFGDDLAMIFLPGEVVVDYVLRLKKEFDPARLWVTAYANDLPCYIPSERILKEGGYEGAGAMVYYARPTKLKSGLEQQILDAIHEIVPKSFDAKP